MKLLKMTLLALLVVSSGCSTIHFTQDVDSSAYQTEKVLPSHWHDSTLDGMVEVSPPVNLYTECQGKPWKKVTSELTFLNGLTTAVVSWAVTSVAPVLEFVNLYTPWTVQTTCAK